MQTTTLTQLLWILIFSFPVIVHMFIYQRSDSLSQRYWDNPSCQINPGGGVEETWLCVCVSCIFCVLVHHCMRVYVCVSIRGVFWQCNESSVRMLLGAVRGPLRPLGNAALWKPLRQKPLATWKWKQSLICLIHPSIDSPLFCLSLPPSVLLHVLPHHFLFFTLMVKHS